MHWPKLTQMLEEKSQTTIKRLNKCQPLQILLRYFIGIETTPTPKFLMFSSSPEKMSRNRNNGQYHTWSTWIPEMAITCTHTWQNIPGNILITLLSSIISSETFFKFLEFSWFTKKLDLKNIYTCPLPKFRSFGNPTQK